MNKVGGGNFLFSGGQVGKIQPQQVDEGGIYYGSLEHKRRFSFGDEDNPDSKKRWSGWHNKSTYEFVEYFKRKGINITIYDIRKLPITE